QGATEAPGRHRSPRAPPKPQGATEARRHGAPRPGAPRPGAPRGYASKGSSSSSRVHPAGSRVTRANIKAISST
ncbi:MAG TPA: hypothetical protein ENK18_21360, partial [Deltaproteobacteria bacterium]|nr:hypothetical protein [Deltaproteobacteria bacterium]